MSPTVPRRGAAQTLDMITLGVHQVALVIPTETAVTRRVFGAIHGILHVEITFAGNTEVGAHAGRLK